MEMLRIAVIAGLMLHNINPSAGVNTVCQGLTEHLIYKGYCYNVYFGLATPSTGNSYCTARGASGAVITSTDMYNNIMSFLSGVSINDPTAYFVAMRRTSGSLRTLSNDPIAGYSGDWANDHPTRFTGRIAIEVYNNPENIGNGMLTVAVTRPLSGALCQTKGKCDELVTPNYVIKSCDSETDYDSTCSFSCPTGRERNGPSSATCLDDLTWSDFPPTCPRIECPIPAFDITIGSESCDDGYYFGSTCTYSCFNGYELEGEASLQCVASDTWDENTPQCKPIFCSVQSFLGEGTLFNCDREWGSTCSWDCQTGYIFSPGSPPTITCGGSSNPGTWSASPPVSPQCTIVTCTDLEPWAETDGSILCDGNQYLDTCAYSCYEGFVLVSSASRTCQADGSWDAMGGQSCRPVSCPSGAFDNSFGDQVFTLGSNYDSECTTTCIAGYQPNGDSPITCLQSEQWSGTLPTGCLQIVCPELIFEGTYTCDPPGSRLFGTGCAFVCPDGKEIVSGDIIRRCEEDSQWTGTMPTCAVVMCPPLSFPTGSVACEPQNYDYGTVCSFECPTGYEPDEPGLTMTCGLDKEWSGRMPNTCQRVSCGTYPDPPNGGAFCDGEGTLYQDKCSVVCDSGYKSVVSETECLADGMWSDPPLECERILCPSLSFDGQPGKKDCIPTGYGYLSVCTFECFDGYSLTGSSVLTCQEDGTWDAIVPTCMDVFCPSLSLDDGFVDCPDVTAYASVCKFRCNAALTLYGEEDTTCLSSGQWSNPVPQCKLFDPKCEDAISPSTCEDNCNTNEDCDDDEVCCPSLCGLTCKKIKKDKPIGGLKFDRNMLLLLLAASRRQPSRPRPQPRPQPIRPQCPVCNVNACSITRCPTYLNALCGTSCNGCRAHFFSPYNQRLDLTRQCQCPPYLPPNPACGGHMCNGVGCREFPGSQCRVYGCGQQCSLQFFDRFGRRLPCRSIATCQPGIGSFELCTGQCLAATCPKYPQAHCRVPCRGCGAQFYNQITNQPITDCN